MADTENTADLNTETAPLTLTVQYLKDLSFENPNAPQSLANLNPPPAISVDVDVEVDVDVDVDNSSIFSDAAIELL